METRALMVLCFAALLVLTAYSYLIYPLLVIGWSRLVRRPWRQAAVSPSVTMIISAYNEENVIAEKIENSLALDYEADRLRVLVVSDGSTDRTNSIVRACPDPRVSLLELSNRGGKTVGLNVAVPQTTSEIVVFTDANAMFPRDTLRKMVRSFADPGVGLVTGSTRYTSHAAGEGVSLGLRAYAQFERATKRAESLIASCVGADGAIFAIRRELYKPLAAEDMNDMLTAFDVVEQGSRAILDVEVYCTEPATKNASGELRRQSRIAGQVIAGLWRYRRMMTTTRFGPFGLFLISHKLVRAMVPFFVLLSVAISVYAVLTRSAESARPFAAWIAAVGLVAIVGVIGLTTGRGGRITHLASYLLVALAAHLAGWKRWAAHRVEAAWEPER